MPKSHGFTLIEFITVILLVSILSFGVYTRMPAKEKFTADFSQVFMQDLRLTQTLSMSQNQRYRIVLSASSYQIQNAAGVPIVHPDTQTTTINYPSGLTIGLSPALASNTLIFDGLGAPYSLSGLLSATQNFTVTVGATSRTVSVTPETGLVL